MPMPCKRKCFRSRCPGVADSYKIPKRWAVILEDLPSNISGSMKKTFEKKFNSWSSWQDRHALVKSASPPSCKASRPFLKAAAATQRGMERKTCCSVSSNDKLCGQRQASAPEVWWCRIKSEDFLVIEGIVDGVFCKSKSIIIIPRYYILYLFILIIFN